MTKEKKFAEAMSELLFDLRNEDLNNSMLFDDDTEQIPTDFIDGILDDKQHQKAIKEQIRMSVLEHVTRDPKYFTHPDGDYKYTAPDTYDHAYAVDTYIQERYAETQTKCVYQCSHCNSDNVQVKSWTRPNEGHAFVDEVEGDELGWCDDCQLSSVIDTVEMPRRNKVIGFQVWGDDGSAEDGEMHPHMDASFCVYSLDQANSMMDDTNQGEEQWKLMTIWTDTIEEPTMMFEGLPRS